MFIVNVLVDRKLKEEELQYDYTDNDISFDDCPRAFSTFEKAMEYAKEYQGCRDGVYCMVFEEKINHPFDIPVVWNGKFDKLFVKRKES